MTETAMLTAEGGCTMSATDIFTNGPGTEVVRCGELVIAVVAAACAHEHVDRALACAGCAAELQRCDGILICPRCQDGPEPHDCRVTLQIRWLCDA